METEVDCKCLKIIGHLENLRQCWPQQYKPSPGPLSLGDWISSPYIWLHYVESSDGILPADDVLISTNTRYWSIHDVQRYFIGDLHCEQVLFTYQYPNLRMPTILGSYFWKANTALKLPPALYLKEFHMSLEITLKKMEANQSQMDRLIISDQLIKIDRLDFFKRKTFFRILLNILSPFTAILGILRSTKDVLPAPDTYLISVTKEPLHFYLFIKVHTYSDFGFQDRLQLVSFENLCSKRLEGVRLIQQLACFNADTLKYLFLWRFVLPNENPLLINYSYLTGSGQYIPRPKTKQCFLRSLGELRNLRVLALEYSHIADGTGGALMALMPVIKKPHFKLQIICREDQTPGRTDAALGVAGYDIPDTVWKRVAVACPDIYILMSFFRIRDYDNVRRFLTPNIPIRETHLELGIDLKMRQRQDSDISCFIRHIAHHYCSTLVTLSIHQWRFATFPLRRVFELMPRLVRFFYIGRVEDELDLRKMLQIVAGGVCDRLRQIKVQIQDDESKRNYWQNTLDTLCKEYKDIMELFEIDFCIGVYKN